MKHKCSPAWFLFLPIIHLLFFAFSSIIYRCSLIDCILTNLSNASADIGTFATFSSDDASRCFIIFFLHSSRYLVASTTTAIFEVFLHNDAVCAKTPNTCNLGDLFWQEKHHIEKGIYVETLQSKRADISFQKHFPAAYTFLLTVLALTPSPFLCPTLTPVYIMHSVSLIHSERGFSHIWGNKYLYS